MNTPNLDALDHATLRHLVAWLDYAVRDEDRLAAQNAIEAGLAEKPEAIDAGLAEKPEAIDAGDTWAQIASRGGFS